LQSSSTPLHCSELGETASLHPNAPPLHVVTPSAQAPGLPVSHDAPPPVHCTPSTLATRSVKSALLV
jgi:hypothetical protein